MKKYGKKLRKNGIRKWHETEEAWKKKMAEMKRELNGGHEKIRRRKPRIYKETLKKELNCARAIK